MRNVDPQSPRRLFGVAADPRSYRMVLAFERKASLVADIRARVPRVDLLRVVGRCALRHEAATPREAMRLNEFAQLGGSVRRIAQRPLYADDDQPIESGSGLIGAEGHADPHAFALGFGEVDHPP